MLSAALVVALALIGTTIAYMGFSSSSLNLFRSSSSESLRQTRKIHRCSTLRFSPDGKYLGYSDQQGIYLQLVATNAAQDAPFA